MLSALVYKSIWLDLAERLTVRMQLGVWQHTSRRLYSASTPQTAAPLSMAIYWQFLANMSGTTLVFGSRNTSDRGAGDLLFPLPCQRPEGALAGRSRSSRLRARELKLLLGAPETITSGSGGAGGE